MPFSPFNDKCGMLGCKNRRTALSGYCTDHGGRSSVNRSSDSAYKSAAWKSIRQRQLGKQPLCQACLLRGQVCAAVDVDHVFPWRQFGQQSFRNNVFQSLCRECHAYKTQQERQGKYLFFGGAALVEYGPDDFPKKF